MSVEGIEYFLTDDGKGKVNKTPILPLDKKLAHEGRTLRIVTPEQYDKHLLLKSNPILTTIQTKGGSGTP